MKTAVKNKQVSEKENVAAAKFHIEKYNRTVHRMAKTTNYQLYFEKASDIIQRESLWKSEGTTEYDKK